MAIDSIKGRTLRITGPVPEISLVNARITEEMNKPSIIDAELMFFGSNPKPEKLLRKLFEIEMDREVGGVRYWSGYCVECEFLSQEGDRITETTYRYRMRLQSWNALLKYGVDCKIFQDMATQEIISEVFQKKYGFTDFSFGSSVGKEKRPYTVQYRESDFDFVQRLLEGDGLSYYFAYEKGKHTLTIDKYTRKFPSSDAKDAIPLRDLESIHRGLEIISDWKKVDKSLTGKVVLRGYNYENSKEPFTGNRAADKNDSDSEVYEYSGYFESKADSNSAAKHQADMLLSERTRYNGTGLATTIAVGLESDLSEHPVDAENIKFVPVRAVHLLQIEGMDGGFPLKLPRMKSESEDKKKKSSPNIVYPMHQVVFEAINNKVNFVPEEATPSPIISGVQTAVVVGPKGDEIHTDEFGRIKIQFHWDRDGKKDDKSSCYVRVVTPMAGTGWGMASIPRIKQEVVVQFEEGNPDRPIVTGMVYNDQNKSSLKFAGEKTQFGMRSDSHKQEDKTAYHEFIFEDEKDKEFVRFQSQKDYKVIVKNDTTIEYGTDKAKKGDLKLDVWNDTVETFGVAGGNGGLDQKVEKDFKKEIVKGNYKLNVTAGKRDTTIAKDDTLTAKANVKYTAKAAMTLEATNSLTLKCGGSTIEMTPSGITIKSVKIDIKASATLTAEGASTTVKGSGVLTLQGGIVKIN